MNKPREFFDIITSEIPKKKVKLILVTHILPDRIVFLDALSKIIDIACIIPKPKSISPKSLKEIEKKYKIIRATKNYLKDKSTCIELINKYVGDNEFIISDIGGYFSETANHLINKYKDRFLGIVEDTENGMQKYEKIKLSCPIFSVARSSLKYPEDILVAYSTVYSAESILRQRNEIISGKRATIIGYGKIGQHIARDLVSKRAKVTICDNNSSKLIHAFAEGHNVSTKENAISNSELLFCITGNKSINSNDFNRIKGECYIFSITSSDDEFNLENKPKYLKKEPFYPIGTTFYDSKRKIHLVNNGNAINFLHKAVVGNFIYLVQAEIISCINQLILNKNNKGFLELNKEEINEIASIWINTFT
tara:strand:- start:648 stop:1742 length:1095 start_codon:yes stop_codon:yes gene_type:complete